jgi:hypothetical protein
MLCIRAKALIETSDDGKTWLCNSTQSGGLYGVEDDSSPADIKEIADEQLAELTDALLALGFAQPEIDAAKP